MRAALFAMAVLALPAPAALADPVVAARTIRAKAVIAPGDLAFGQGEMPGAITDPAEAIGLESRVVIYAGRPIRPDDLAPPALIERNQIVPMIYDVGGLRIATEARAMDRAAVGDRIRAMNIESRATVVGTVGTDGTIYVGGTL